MAGHRKSPRGMRARTSTRPYRKLPNAESLVRMRALVKGWVQVQEPSKLLVQPWKVSGHGRNTQGARLREGADAQRSGGGATCQAQARGAAQRGCPPARKPRAASSGSMQAGWTAGLLLSCLHSCPLPPTPGAAARPPPGCPCATRAAPPAPAARPPPARCLGCRGSTASRLHRGRI
jgi:hypothetical protein